MSRNTSYYRLPSEPWSLVTAHLSGTPILFKVSSVCAGEVFLFVLFPSKVLISIIMSTLWHTIQNELLNNLYQTLSSCFHHRQAFSGNHLIWRKCNLSSRCVFVKLKGWQAKMTTSKPPRLARSSSRWTQQMDWLKGTLQKLPFPPICFPTPLYPLRSKPPFKRWKQNRMI